MELGRIEEWKAAMKNVKGIKHFSEVCLWIDSTDFKMKDIGGKKRKARSWSFKCNSRGRRFMVLRDGIGRIRRMWGGYHQKCMMEIL